MAKELQETFRELPRSAVVAIGARAAMRALPILARAENRAAFGYWRESERREHLLSVLHGYQIAAAADAAAAATATARLDEDVQFLRARTRESSDEAATAL